MIVDTSAFIAVLLNEQGYEVFVEKLAAAHTLQLSTATYVETCIVLEHKLGTEGTNDFRDLLFTAQIESVPVCQTQAILACEAYKTYGKGGQNKAQLNYGDCFSYALAKHQNKPLLFKGYDFVHTDLEAA